VNKLGQSLWGTAKPTLLRSQSYWHHSLCCITQLCSAGPESAAVVSGTCYLCSQKLYHQIHRLCHNGMLAAHQMLPSYTAASGLYSGVYSTTLRVTAKRTAYCFPVSHRPSYTALPPLPAVDSCMTLLLHTRLCTATARQKAPAKLQASARWQASARHQATAQTNVARQALCAYGPPTSVLFSLAAQQKRTISMHPLHLNTALCCCRGVSLATADVCAGTFASAPGVGPGRTGHGPRSTVWVWRTPLTALTTVPGPSPLMHLPLWPTSLGTP